jgi:anthranilate synthase component 1
MMTSTSQVQLTPIAFDVDLLELHAISPERYPFLLESSAGDPRLARFDILFACPRESLILAADYRLQGPAAADGLDFLEAFDQWWQTTAPDNPRLRGAGASLPFTGGWFVTLGYGLAREIEPVLKIDSAPGQPVATATRVPVAIIRDRLLSEAWIVAEKGYEGQVSDIQRDIRVLPRSHDTPAVSLSTDLREEAAAGFLAAVRTAKQHIARGDIFQANLSRLWSGTLVAGTTPHDVYRQLRAVNPAPFAGLAVFADHAIISSSPERLLRSRDGKIETRPIAGTRPRDPGLDDDAPLRAELLSHPKERAEHIMLIDLERNDLGRVCRAGTVSVDEFMVVESYSHVHHIVSNVCGELLESATPAQMIRAVFPGGTITGCPKVRCIEIIDALENRPRGLYTGSMGYINLDGSADFNILIRTMLTAKQEFSFATGSGIVADSDPVAELEETRAKAKGLILALAGDDA